MKIPIAASGRRRLLAVASATALAAAGIVAGSAGPAYAQGACAVTYDAAPWFESPTHGGFTAHITITNLGAPIDGWQLNFTLPSGQGFTHGWSANWSGSSALTATNLDWNGQLGTGGSTTIGFNGSWTGGFSEPVSFSLNGETCDGGGGGEQPAPPTVTLTSPTGGQQFTAGTAVPLAADASSAEGITRVEFFVNGQLVGADTTAPYTATATGLAVGGHSATAVAFDAGDPQQSTQSAPVSFSVVDVVEPVLLANPASLSLLEGDSGTVTFSLSQAPGGSVTVNLSTTGNVAANPSSFTLDNSNFSAGVAVTVTGLAAGTGGVTASAAGFDPVTVPVTVTEPGDPGERVANPYAGANVYVDPVWSGRVLDEAAATGGQLGQRMAEVATYPTAVWMDRRGAITDGIGLVGHLDNALAQQQAGGGEMVFQVVVYNLPNRDCAALASNGELLISENGFQIYQEEYIDVIAGILSRPEYAGLRIVTIIEVDSLPNLVTNLGIPECQQANGPGGYRDGIRYALNQFKTIPNVYSYLDIAHSGWLGWDSNFGPAVNLYVDMLTSTAHAGPPPGLDSINGFITNSANYTPTAEPFLPDSALVLPGGGNPIRSSDFYEWNPFFDELSFAQALHAAFTQRGMSGFGMLVDTSRNGWGGPDRPTQVSGSTNINTYVDESRIDQRPHRGGWCNQAGAGIGERPAASPAPDLHAYVWVKPPGESDGISDPDFEPDPNDPAKQHDPMCDPNEQNVYNPAHPTNALPNAPHAGRWFPEQFAMLVQNAFPPIS
jgi:cellulose 1,4-beta-cellobiosidase